MIYILLISRGHISASQQRPLRSSPIVHSFTASGHTKAVLSVFATDELLFSSSKGKSSAMYSSTMSGVEDLKLVNIIF